MVAFFGDQFGFVRRRSEETSVPHGDAEQSFDRDGATIADAWNRIATVVEKVAEKWLEDHDGGREAPVSPRNDAMLSPKEASVLMRLNEQTLMKWCRDGRIDAVKIGGNKANRKGGKWLIPREAVEVHLQKRHLINGKNGGSAK